MRLVAGSEVNESLRLLRPLGQGGMGSVWACEDRTRGCEVAVKFVLARHVRDDPELVARFRREAAVCARIRSRHVIRTFESGETAEGIPFLVMELLEGETLADRLERDRWLDLDDAVPIVLQIADALGAAHALGLVHRDIKPENLFLTASREAPVVKVLDFGTVKRTLEREDSIVTATGVMVGTPEYMSPEQVLGTKGVDHRADLWALGVVAYEMLVGQEPFRGTNPQALCLSICTATYPPARERLPGLPPGIDEWFARALARSPANRFTSAAEMATELEAITGVGGLDVPPEESLDERAVPSGLGPDPERAERPTAPDEAPTQQLSGRALLATARGVFQARARATVGYTDEPVTTVKREPPAIATTPSGPAGALSPSGTTTPKRDSATADGEPGPADEEPTRQAQPRSDLLALVQEQETARRRRKSTGRSGSGRGSRSRSSHRRTASRAKTGTGTADRRTTGKRSTAGRSAGRRSQPEGGPAESTAAPGRSAKRGPSKGSQRRARRPSGPNRGRVRLLIALALTLGALLVVVAAVEVGRAGRGVTGTATQPRSSRPSDDSKEDTPRHPMPNAEINGVGANRSGLDPSPSDSTGAATATGSAAGGTAPEPLPSGRPPPYRGRDAGYLSLECEPACDEVVVGDDALGPTPIEKHALRPGTYRVELLAGDQPAQVISVRITPGRTTARLVLMDEAP